MPSYHVRVHYRTSAPARKVSWFRAIKADNQTDAGNRAIEQHEAFRQEVSDAVEVILNCTNMNKRYGACLALNRFIIAKPVDPLVDVFAEIGAMEPKCIADELRAAIEKRGGKIIFNKE